MQRDANTSAHLRIPYNICNKNNKYYYEQYSTIQTIIKFAKLNVRMLSVVNILIVLQAINKIRKNAKFVQRFTPVKTH